MNYTSQLKGWAVDRVIQANSSKDISAEDIIAEAKKLADFCYVAAEDLAQARALVERLEAEESVQ